MNNFQAIAASPEALAEFLRRLSAIETPWDEAFHRRVCDACAEENCDERCRTERDNPLWWLGLPAAEGNT